jgi:hypothetical protein
MKKQRPHIFVGSSGEGHKFAEAIQLNLERVADVTIWSQGVFGLSQGSLESLVDSLDQFDFAILVLTPDDLIVSRGETDNSPRDNVLFELGLFIGRIGRERTFIVFDRNASIKIPSDLAGITPADFQVHSNGNLQASLGGACTRIKQVIERLGIYQKDEAPLIDAKVQYQVLADLLDIAALQFFILMHESGVKLTREGTFEWGPRYEYRLAHRGRASGHGAMRVSDLCRKLADAGILQCDLRDRVSLTERGSAFAEWLVSSDYRATYFWSDHGGWGDRPSDMGDKHVKDSPRNPILELHKRNLQQAEIKPSEPDNTAK